MHIMFQLINIDLYLFFIYKFRLQPISLSYRQQRCSFYSSFYAQYQIIELTFTKYIIISQFLFNGPKDAIIFRHGLKYCHWSQLLYVTLPDVTQRCQSCQSPAKLSTPHQSTALAADCGHCSRPFSLSNRQSHVLVRKPREVSSSILSPGTPRPYLLQVNTNRSVDWD